MLLIQLIDICGSKILAEFSQFIVERIFQSLMLGEAQKVNFCRQCLQLWKWQLVEHFHSTQKRTSICRCGANLFHHFQLVFEPIMVKWFFYQRPLSPLSIFLVSCFENRTGMFQLMQPIFSTIAAALVRVNQFGPRISVFSLLKQNSAFLQVVFSNQS